MTCCSCRCCCRSSSSCCRSSSSCCRWRQRSKTPIEDVTTIANPEDHEDDEDKDLEIFIKCRLSTQFAHTNSTNLKTKCLFKTFFASKAILSTKQLRFFTALLNLCICPTDFPGGDCSGIILQTLLSARQSSFMKDNESYLGKIIHL